MKNKRKDAKILLLSYAILVAVSMMIPNDISRFNGYLIVIFGFILMIYERDPLVYILSASISLLMAAFSLKNGVKLMYIAGDTALFFYVISSVNLINQLRYGKLTWRVLGLLSLLMIVLSTIGMANPGAYEFVDGENRYNGVFVSGNTSACMFLIVEILLWEKLKCSKYNKILVVGFGLAFFAYVFASQTRTMFFALPYWGYQLYKVFGKKITITASILSLPVLGFVFAYFVEHARLEEDASYMTRVSIYAIQLSGIWENYIVIPHGSEEAVRLVRNEVKTDNFSPHNDFLAYTYNWGIFFLIILFYFYKKFRQYRLFNLNNILILIAYSGFALHNLLFLPYVWLPLIFVFIQDKQIQFNKLHSYENVSTCKKIQ